MKSRCYNKNTTDYKYYGGRGIGVCDEWLNDFENFKEWSKNNGYNDTCTIDRIDVNKAYSPHNCRWVDFKTQNNNKTNNCYITFSGITLTLAQWSDKLNINYSTLKSRIEHNIPIEKAFYKGDLRNVR